MTKEELIRRIAEDLLQEDMLNQADYPNVETLLDDVCRSISANLSDYTLIVSSFILD